MIEETLRQIVREELSEAMKDVPGIVREEISAATKNLYLPELMTPQDVAKYLGVTVPTLAKWRHEGKGPKFVKDGLVFYKVSDVHEYVNSKVNQ